MLTATALALSLVLPTSVSREQFIRTSVAVSIATLGGRAATATPGDYTKQGISSGSAVAMGSDGISAYQSMVLDKTVKELDEVKDAAAGSLKPVLDAFGELAKQVRDNDGLKTIDGAKLEATSASLATLAAGNEGLLAQSQVISKLGLQVGVAAKKGDVGATAKAATGLLDNLVDFGYSFKGISDERPLAEYREGLDINPLKIGK